MEIKKGPSMERKDTHTHTHATHPYTNTEKKITHLFFGQNEYERLKRR